LIRGFSLLPLEAMPEYMQNLKKSKSGKFFYQSLIDPDQIFDRDRDRDKNFSIKV